MALFDALFENHLQHSPALVQQENNLITDA